jgi:hypothetical protein
VGDRIYITCTITYVVVDDPEEVEITIPAAGTFHLLNGEEQVKKSENKGEITSVNAERMPVIEGFDCYLDVGPVYARAEELKAKAK